MELAVHPEGTPHNEIWDQSSTKEADIVVYTTTRGTSDYYPAPKTVEEIGPYFECNPFAMKGQELGKNEPTN